MLTQPANIPRRRRATLLPIYWSAKCREPLLQKPLEWRMAGIGPVSAAANSSVVPVDAAKELIANLVTASGRTESRK